MADWGFQLRGGDRLAGADGAASPCWSKSVDKKDAAQRQVQVVPVRHADPQAMSQSLNEIFVRGAQSRRGQQTVSISNPSGSDNLLIKANETEFAEIKQVIEQLDSEEADIGGEIKVVPLKYTDATETMEILQEYLRKSGSGGRGRSSGELAGDVRIRRRHQHQLAGHLRRCRGNRAPGRHHRPRSTSRSKTPRAPRASSSCNTPRHRRSSRTSPTLF